MNYIEDSIISIVFSPENSQLEILFILTVALCRIFNAWLGSGPNSGFAIVNHRKCWALK